MSTAIEARCTNLIWDSGWSNRCMREAKTDYEGARLCARCAGAKRAGAKRSQAASDARHARWDAQDKARAAARESLRTALTEAASVIEVCIQAEGFGKNALRLVRAELEKLNGNG